MTPPTSLLDRAQLDRDSVRQQMTRGLAGAGAKVILNGRNEARLAEAVARLRDEGLTVDAMSFDVTSPSAVTAAIEKIEREDGPIDILVNNAGMPRRAPLDQFSHEQWQELMRTNVDSVFLVGQAVARFMITRGAGKIVNICSVQSELGRPDIAAYTATKGAVKMLTKGMAIDWGKHGSSTAGLISAYAAGLSLGLSLGEYNHLVHAGAIAFLPALSLVDARGAGYDSVRDLWLRSRLPPSVLELLAAADAFRSIGLDRRNALWAVRGLNRSGDKDDLPLFAAAAGREIEPDR